jgi:hypothetical protein
MTESEANLLSVASAALVAVGAFYTFAGLVGLRVAVQGRLFDVAISQISLKRPPIAETARTVWLLFASLFVLAGGLFLILRLEWAAAAFVTSSVGQAAYLLFVAPVLLDHDDPPDAKGRQQTINAFILYVAATLFVLWAYRTQKLMSPNEVGWPAVVGALAVLSAAAVHAAFRFAYPLAKGPAGLFNFGVGNAPPSDEAMNDAATDSLADGAPLADSRRILVMSEYQCDPLWTHDPGRDGTISPRDLPLSESLIADLQAWAESYDGSFNLEDMNSPHWSEERYAAHNAAGLVLGRRLKRELPDRQIFVWHVDSGHVEIIADDSAP